VLWDRHILTLCDRMVPPPYGFPNLRPHNFYVCPLARKISGIFELSSSGGIEWYQNFSILKHFNIFSIPNFYRSQSFADYSLSRNYQLQENAFAMRLVLPLDISYALFYTLFVAFSTYLRAYRSSLTPADFTHYFDYGNTVIPYNLEVEEFCTLYVDIHFISIIAEKFT
jgi:hypothetical protein